MRFKVAYHTDIGIKKNTNQDGLLLKGAETPYGDVLLAVVCDGMGGLAKGELASSQVLRAFADWFEQDAPGMLQTGFSEEKLFSAWRKLLAVENQKLAEYGAENNISLGTTVTAMLLMGNDYYYIHIGDSRIYELDASLKQLTSDHTVVAKEIAAGRLTPEQAASDPRRNVLLQCVGASQVIEPDCCRGVLASDAGYLLCSDGFRHVITADEIFAQLNPKLVKDEASMTAGLKGLIETVKVRQETDNITAVMIHT